MGVATAPAEELSFGIVHRSSCLLRIATQTPPLHNDTGWTETPGMRMERRGKAQVLQVDCQELEFVLNNGGSDWDSCRDSDDGSGNYRARGSGLYKVKGGRVDRLPDDAEY